MSSCQILGSLQHRRLLSMRFLGSNLCFRMSILDAIFKNISIKKPNQRQRRLLRKPVTTTFPPFRAKSRFARLYHTACTVVGLTSLTQRYVLRLNHIVACIFKSPVPFTYIILVSVLTTIYPSVPFNEYVRSFLFIVNLPNCSFQSLKIKINLGFHNVQKSKNFL